MVVSQVRYRAVRAGGGCSLEVVLSPVALLCNAAPIALTLRAHDAAPLCKLDPGAAISPPSAILKVTYVLLPCHCLARVTRGEHTGNGYWHRTRKTGEITML